MPASLARSATSLPTSARGVFIGVLAFHTFIQARSRHNGLAFHIIDDLGIDVLARAEHRQDADGHCGPAKGVAVARLATLEKGFAFFMARPYFFLPSLRRMYSPRRNARLCPCKAQAGDSERISEATWPTFCLSYPVTSIEVGDGHS